MKKKKNPNLIKIQGVVVSPPAKLPVSSCCEDLFSYARLGHWSVLYLSSQSSSWSTSPCSSPRSSLPPPCCPGPSLHSAVITVFGLTPYLNTFPGGQKFNLNCLKSKFKLKFQLNSTQLNSILSDFLAGAAVVLPSILIGIGLTVSFNFTVFHRKLGNHRNNKF